MPFVAEGDQHFLFSALFPALFKCSVMMECLNEEKEKKNNTRYAQHHDAIFFKKLIDKITQNLSRNIKQGTQTKVSRIGFYQVHPSIYSSEVYMIIKTYIHT